MVFKQQVGPCLGVCWTVFALLWGSQFVRERLSQEIVPGLRDQFQLFLVQFLLFFAVYVFNSWLSIGQNLALLQLARRVPGAFREIFGGGRYLLTTILAGVVLALLLVTIGLVNLIWIPILTGVMGPGSPVTVLVFAVAIALALITVAYVALRFSQFHFMILDQGAGVIDSLRFSWEATRRQAATLILIFALVFLINFGGLLVCLIGIVFTVPFTSLMLAIAYMSLTGQPLGQQKHMVEFLDEEIRQ
jgi:hypothetical protein